MIVHIVMLSLKDDADPNELSEVMAGLDALKSRMSGFHGMDHGPNIDAEEKSPDYPYGFAMRFTDRAALDAYASDAEHQALGARLVAMCQGGADGIMVYDIDTGD